MANDVMGAVRGRAAANDMASGIRQTKTRRKKDRENKNEESVVKLNAMLAVLKIKDWVSLEKMKERC